MKVGDYIYCTDKEEFKRYLKYLEEAGYHAVAYSYGRNIIAITGLPGVETMNKAEETSGE